MHLYRKNEPMKLHTSFRIGGPADIYAEPEDADELRELLSVADGSGMDRIVIGRGTNLLVGDGGFRGMVICLGSSFGRISVRDGRIKAEAGAALSAVAGEALNHSLKGLEFASGIPGSVGGAVFMNAGAYGGEIKDVLESAEILEMDGSLVTVSADELELGYRCSNVESLLRIVLSAVFRLEEGDADTIRSAMQDMNRRRMEKQPLNMPSAGSAFKRPEGHFAGKLIEDAGLKGFRIGDAMVSEKHAGFVVNAGEATAADVRALLEEVRRRVFEQSGVMLEPEVRFTGEF